MKSDLVILSERDTLKYLNEKGVFPTEFFTDLEVFKDRCPMFENATLVILLSGLCNFSRMEISHLANSLQERVKDKEDRGLVNMYVLSDTVLPLCEVYYKYDDLPLGFTRYSGKRISDKKLVDIWSSIDYTPCKEPRVFLEEKEYKDALESVKTKRVGTDSGLGSIKIPEWTIAKEDK